MIVKKLAIAALVAAQIGTSAAAADLVDERSVGVRTGAFAGARLRIPLDAEPRERVRASLTLAPTRHDIRADGPATVRIGQGLELAAEGEDLRFDLAGQPVSRLVERGNAPGGPRSNVSTLGWVAIGVGVLLVATFALFESCRAGDICGDDGDG